MDILIVDIAVIEKVVRSVVVYLGTATSFPETSPAST